MTPEQRSDEIERLLLNFCPVEQMAELLTIIAESIRQAWNDGYHACTDAAQKHVADAVTQERAACRKEYEEIHGIPMREIARILALKWFLPEDWRNPHEGMQRE